MDVWKITKYLQSLIHIKYTVIANFFCKIIFQSYLIKKFRILNKSFCECNKSFPGYQYFNPLVVCHDIRVPQILCFEDVRQRKTIFIRDIAENKNRGINTFVEQKQEIHIA